MGKSFGKNIRSNLSGKYSQKFFDHAKQSATDAFKTASKGAIPRTAETTGDLISKQITNKITKISKNLLQIIKRQLQMSMTKKYLKKDIYLQKKNRKLLII